MKTTYRPLILFTVCLLLLILPTTTAAQEDDQEYPWVPPEFPTNVYFDMIIIDLPTIDARAETYTLEGDMTLEWIDERLAFDPKEFGSNVQIYHGSQATDKITNEIWSPVIEFENIRGPRKVVNRSLVIDQDGVVVYEEHFVATLAANLDLHDLPFDKQSLKMIFTSFLYPAEEMVFSPESIIEFRPGFALNEWVVAGEPQVKISEQGVFGISLEGQSPGAPFSHGEFIINLEREPGFYIWKLLIPILIITSISWVGFWRKPTEGGRLAMTFSCMLTVIAYNFVIGNSLPRIPYLTRLDRVFILTYAFIALAIFQGTIVSYLVNNERDRRVPAIDRFSRIAFPAVYLAIYASLLLI